MSTVKRRNYSNIIEILKRVRYFYIKLTAKHITGYIRSRWILRSFIVFFRTKKNYENFGHFEQMKLLVWFWSKLCVCVYLLPIFKLKSFQFWIHWISNFRTHQKINKLPNIPTSVISNNLSFHSRFRLINVCVGVCMWYVYDMCNE